MPTRQPMDRHELRRRVSATGSYFFTAKSMKFSGDTMRNYGVRAKPVLVVPPSGGPGVQCWELYRKQPVKHGLTKSAYFACDDFRRVHRRHEP